MRARRHALQNMSDHGTMARRSVRSTAKAGEVAVIQLRECARQAAGYDRQGGRAPLVRPEGRGKGRRACIDARAGRRRVRGNRFSRLGSTFPRRDDAHSGTRRSIRHFQCKVEEPCAVNCRPACAQGGRCGCRGCARAGGGGGGPGRGLRFFRDLISQRSGRGSDSSRCRAMGRDIIA